jgi:hypothetical protein
MVSRYIHTVTAHTHGAWAGGLARRERHIARSEDAPPSTDDYWVDVAEFRKKKAETSSENDNTARCMAVPHCPDLHSNFTAKIRVTALSCFLIDRATILKLTVNGPVKTGSVSVSIIMKFP